MADACHAFATRAALVSEDFLRRRGGEKWNATPRGVLPAWIAESDFEVPGAVQAALTDVIDRGEFGYVSAARHDAYRASVARWYQDQHDMPMDPAHVHPVGDVLEAYRRAIRDFTEPNTRVILPVPSYPPFALVAAEEGREIVRISADPQVDLTALNDALSQGPALLVLCNPHNPLGRVATSSELTAISEIVERHGGRVFADEIHAPLVLGSSPHIPYASISDAAASHTLTAFAASKAFNLPALKTAALITSNAADVARWESLGPLATHGASVMGLAAGSAALDHGRDWLEAFVHYLRGNLDLVHRAVMRIDGARARPSEATYLQWIDLSGVVTARSMTPAARSEAAGVLVSDGANFGGFDDCIRFNFATPRPLLEDALSRLVDAFDPTGATSVA